MTERRPLTEGIRSPMPAPAAPPVDPNREKEFVFGTNARSQRTATTAAPAHSRVPLSTRIRADFAAALKRASLERQLHGLEPSTLCDILEQALEPWLESHGYTR